MTGKEKKVQKALGTLKKYKAKFLIEITVDEFYAKDNDAAQEEVIRRTSLFLNKSPDHPGVEAGADWDYAYGSGDDDMADFISNNGYHGVYTIDEDGEWVEVYLDE